MPKINRYSISNFLYGIDTDRMLSDRVIECYGDNVLLDAGNMVGKSNSIRTIIQNICPLAEVGKKISESYERNKEPVYVLIEWILDDNKTKMLSGIGFRRKNNHSEDTTFNKNKEFDFFNFIIQYKDSHPLDMDNISIYNFDKKTGIKYVKPLQELHEEIKAYQKHDRANVFSYAKSSVKEYQSKLEEYGISIKEWKDIIIKLNAEETNLGKYFDDCKTITKLIRDKIIPEVEISLSKNKNENRLLEVQKQVNKFLDNMTKNEQELKRHTSLLEFKQVINDTRELVQKVILENENISNVEAEISKFNSLGKRFLNDISDEIALNKEEIEFSELEIKEIEYHRDSYEAFQKEKDLSAAQDKYDSVIFDLNKNNNEKVDIENKINVLELLNLNNEKIDIEKDISTEEVAIEKMSLEEGEILDKINNLGYSIKVILENICDEINSELQSMTETMKDYENDLFNNKSKIQANNKLIDDLNKQIKILDLTISDYMQFNTYYKDKYEDIKLFITESLLGEDIDFDSYKDKIEKEDLEIENSIDSNNLLSQNNKLKISELENRNKSINDDKKEVEYEIKNTELEIDKFNDINKSLEVYSNDFEIELETLWDKDKCIPLLNSKFNTIEKNKQYSMKQIDTISEKIKKLKGEINPTISDLLIKTLEKHNINFDNGYEYLLELDLSIEEKHKLVRNNPLLPYSIILTKQDFDKIKQQDLDVFTDTATPIVIRTEINNVMDYEYCNQVYTFGSNNMLMSFDLDMLDREKRELEIKGLEEELKNLEVNIEKCLLEQQSINKVINFVESNTFKINDIDIFNNKKSENEAKLKSLQDEYVKNESDIEALDTENTNLSKLINELKISKNNNQHKLNDLDKLIAKFASYKENKDNSDNLKDKLETIEKENKDINEVNENINEQKFELNSKIVNLKNELKHKEAQKNQYISFEDGELDQRNVEILINDYNEYQRKSKSDDISQRKVKISKLREKLENKKNAILLKMKSSKLEIIPNAPLSLETEIELRSKLDDVAAKIIELDREERKLNDKVTREKTRLEILLESIKNKYGKDKIPNELIVVRDFDKHINDAKTNIAKINNKLKSLERTYIKIERKVESISEFESNLNLEEDFKCNIDEYEEKVNSLVRELNAININKDKLDKKLMNMLYLDINNFDTSNCPDIDNMKVLLEANKDNVYSLDTIIEQNINTYIDGKIMITNACKEHMETEKEMVIREVVLYVKDVIEELRIIDKLGNVDGEVIFKLGIPKDEFIKYDKLKEFIENAINLNEKDTTYLFTTYELLNFVVNVETFKTRVLKYEINSKYLVNWNEFKNQSSGAQTFAIAFIVLNVLMEYKRYDNLVGRKYASGKVLILDNPFGDTTSSAVLKPVFAIAEKTKTQIISYSHIKNATVVDEFNRMYSMEVERTSSNKELVVIEQIKKPKENEEVVYYNYTLEDEKSKQENLFELL